MVATQALPIFLFVFLRGLVVKWPEFNLIVC